MSAIKDLIWVPYPEGDRQQWKAESEEGSYRVMRLEVKDERGEWELRFPDDSSLYFRTLDEAKIWIIRNQFGRRNISILKRTELADELATLTRGRQTKTTIEVFKNEAAITVKEAAKLAGISHAQLDRYRAVKARGTPEVIEAMKTEKIKVHAAFKTLDPIPQKETQPKATPFKRILVLGAHGPKKLTIFLLP